MKVLHQHAPESSISDIKRIVADDLGQSVDDLFSSFEEHPIASASLAQVHRATRCDTGDVVAIKVQHPRIKSHSAVDMATMEVFICCQLLAVCELYVKHAVHDKVKQKNSICDVTFAADRKQKGCKSSARTIPVSLL